jgi:hypothetical protein
MNSLSLFEYQTNLATAGGVVLAGGEHNRLHTHTNAKKAREFLAWPTYCLYMILSFAT